MKVIGAGFSKTGTKSLNAALTILGYSVYDNLEHFGYHGDQWIKIFEGKGSLEDFKKMYENIDAVVDIPTYFFWEEIHWAFPEAKIILTVRDEASWYKSLCSQVVELNSQFHGVLPRIANCLKFFIPTVKKFLKFIVYSNNASSNGLIAKASISPIVVNEMMAKQKYRQHNAYVQMKAPKSKLLVFDVREGWEPLCKFLEKEIPDVSFPHKNIGGKDINPQLENHPAVGKRMNNEIYIAIAISLFLLSVAIYFFLSIDFFSFF